MSEIIEMVTLKFNNDIHVSFGDLIVTCYLYAGKRLDAIKWQIEKGLRELLEGDASCGESGCRKTKSSVNSLPRLMDT